MIRQLGLNCDLNEQVAILRQILEENEHLNKVMSRAERLDLPDWYIGAGCIRTTVWNKLSGYALDKFIRDIDILYFDPRDISAEAEAKRQKFVCELNPDIPIPIDVKNQARVHLWYEEKFGIPLEPYRSVESAINTWLSVSSIGVRIQNDDFIVYAPYGLNDLFAMVVRPNKILITKDYYLKKVKRLKNHWPGIKVIEWD